MRSKKITSSKPFLTEAPYLVVVCSDNEGSILPPVNVDFYRLHPVGRRGNWLGTLTYTPSDTSQLRSVLKIPAEYSLEVILLIGIPSERNVKRRRELRNLAYFNAWGRRLPHLKVFKTLSAAGLIVEAGSPFR